MDSEKRIEVKYAVLSERSPYATWEEEYMLKGVRDEAALTDILDHFESLCPLPATLGGGDMQAWVQNVVAAWMFFVFHSTNTGKHEGIGDMVDRGEQSLTEFYVCARDKKHYAELGLLKTEVRAHPVRQRLLPVLDSAMGGLLDGADGTLALSVLALAEMYPLEDTAVLEEETEDACAGLDLVLEPADVDDVEHSVKLFPRKRIVAWEEDDKVTKHLRAIAKWIDDMRPEGVNVCVGVYHGVVYLEVVSPDRFLLRKIYAELEGLVSP